MSKLLYSATSLLMAVVLVACHDEAADSTFTDADGTELPLYSVKVSNAGSLESLVLKKCPQKSEIKALKVSGALSEADMNFLSEIAGRDTLDGELRYLDMTAAAVDRIGDRLFEHCRKLQEVKLPNGTTEIGLLAFWNCSNLTEVTIPNSVTEIGMAAFSNCRNLTKVSIPNSVTEIGMSAFSGCSGLTEVTIPNSITKISALTFMGCSGLMKVSIPNSVTEIGGFTFMACSSLTEVTIPNSVTRIGMDAFKGCSSLTDVTSLNRIPPAGLLSLDETTQESAVLHVPEGCAERYETAWGFRHIREDAQGQ